MDEMKEESKREVKRGEQMFDWQLSFKGLMQLFIFSSSGENKRGGCMNGKRLTQN